MIMMRYFGLIVELFCVILKVGPSVSNLLFQTECSKSEITPVINDAIMMNMVIKKPEKASREFAFKKTNEIERWFVGLSFIWDTEQCWEKDIISNIVSELDPESEKCDQC